MRAGFACSLLSCSRSCLSERDEASTNSPADVRRSVERSESALSLCITEAAETSSLAGKRTEYIEPAISGTSIRIAATAAASSRALGACNRKWHPPSSWPLGEEGSSLAEGI